MKKIIAIIILSSGLLLGQQDSVITLIAYNRDPITHEFDNGYWIGYYHRMLKSIEKIKIGGKKWIAIPLEMNFPADVWIAKIGTKLVGFEMKSDTTCNKIVDIPTNMIVFNFKNQTETYVPSSTDVDVRPRKAKKKIDSWLGKYKKRKVKKK